MPLHFQKKSMDNLIFALNTTVPVFLLMLLGALLKKLKWISSDFASALNRFVFMIPLPVLVFKDLATCDFRSVWNPLFVLFCFGATAVSILIAFLISYAFPKNIRGEFIQGSYRSSSALLGIAIITNIYGSSGMGPLMIIGSVPLYNIFAVVVLTLMQPGGDGNEEKHGIRSVRKTLKKTLIGILTNPILIGIFAGVIWSLLKLPMPEIFSKFVGSIGATATPLGLIAMGAMFSLRKATGRIAPSVTAAFLKLFGFCLLFIPLAVLLGFRNQELIAILVMLGSSTTVASFVMAKNMGHEGTVASTVVMLTTMLSAFSLTFWLWLLKSFSLI